MALPRVGSWGGARLRVAQLLANLWQGPLHGRQGMNHPMRVRTAHPGWAHAGRQRAGWAKGARSWRTPSVAKDAAEAYRSGFPLVYDVKEVATGVEGAMA